VADVVVVLPEKIKVHVVGLVGIVASDPFRATILINGKPLSVSKAVLSLETGKRHTLELTMAAPDNAATDEVFHQLGG